MADMSSRAAVRRSKFMLIREIVAYSALFVMGASVILYICLGYINYLNGMPLSHAFLPYHALRLHDSNFILTEAISKTQSAYSRTLNQVTEIWGLVVEDIIRRWETQFTPFMQENPVWGFLLLAGIGFTISLILLYVLWYVSSRFLRILRGRFGFSAARSRSKKRVKSWDCRSQRKPTEDQLNDIAHKLENAVQRAPALNGLIPINADDNIRELAARYRNNSFKYRAAIYVKGAIEGTQFDANYELPLTIDQIEHLCELVGEAATYTTMPLELVILESKKGAKEWALTSAAKPIQLKHNYPVEIIKRVMMEYRAWFILDERGKKSTVGL